MNFKWYAVELSIRDIVYGDERRTINVRTTSEKKAGKLAIETFNKSYRARRAEDSKKNGTTYDGSTPIVTVGSITPLDKDGSKRSLPT